MKKEYFVEENNSGGVTKALSCSIEKGSIEKPHIVKIEARNIDSAIKKFEKKFNIDWMYENSYEGGSCNCCGRRFTLDVLNGDEKDEDWWIKHINIISNLPYKWSDKKYIKMTIK